MTVDTASLRASGKLWRDNYGYLTGHQIVAIADALDAERERVRVLTELLRRVSICIDELDESDICTYFGEVPYALDNEIKSALATAGGEGAKT